MIGYCKLKDNVARSAVFSARPYDYPIEVQNPQVLGRLPVSETYSWVNYGLDGGSAVVNAIIYP